MSDVSEQKLVFVYGSFVAGQPSAGILTPYVLERSAARLMGTVYRLPIGFPAIVYDVSGAESASRQWVVGELLTLKAPDLLFKLMDEFHGLSPLDPAKGVYRRQISKVLVGDEFFEAEVYMINENKLPVDAELIADGNWQRELEARPSLSNLLSDRHKSFLKKLGETKGRQVIPYDLNLSRDLMKMDLIVDKGRRLALSNLGKEVFKYLP